MKQLSLNESYGFVLDLIKYPFVIESVSFVSLNITFYEHSHSFDLLQNLL